MQFEHSKFKSSDFEHLELENSEFENLELKIEKWKGFFSSRGPVRKIFWDLQCRQSTLVLEAQPLLFLLNLATFFASFALFWALWRYFFVLWGLFLELGSGSKMFLEPTYVVNQLWSWKYSPIFLLLLRPN